MSNEIAKHSPEEVAKAKALVAKIDAKVVDLLAPLATEMRIMKWAPEYEAILWEHVAVKAMARARDAVERTGAARRG